MRHGHAHRGFAFTREWLISNGCVLLLQAFGANPGLAVAVKEFLAYPDRRSEMRSDPRIQWLVAQLLTYLE